MAQEFFNVQKRGKLEPLCVRFFIAATGAGFLNVVENFLCVRAGLHLLCNLEEVRDHVVVKVVEVPSEQDPGYDLHKDRLNASDVREQVQVVVNTPLDDFLIELHLNCDVKSDFVWFLI